MEHRLIAEELFVKGYNCAQAVFVAYCDEMKLDKETALKLASSFGAGMGKLREVCGAVTGAFAVAGVLWGYSDVTDDKAKAEHYALIRRIGEEFKEKYGTYICNNLLQGLANINSKDPHPRNEEYYKVRPCVRFVSAACDILDKILAEKAVAV